MFLPHTVNYTKLCTAQIQPFLCGPQIVDNLRSPKPLIVKYSRRKTKYHNYI